MFFTEIEKPILSSWLSFALPGPPAWHALVPHRGMTLCHFPQVRLSPPQSQGTDHLLIVALPHHPCASERPLFVFFLSMALHVLCPQCIFYLFLLWFPILNIQFMSSGIFDCSLLHSQHLEHIRDIGGIQGRYLLSPRMNGRHIRKTNTLVYCFCNETRPTRNNCWGFCLLLSLTELHLTVKYSGTRSVQLSYTLKKWPVDIFLLIWKSCSHRAIFQIINSLSSIPLPESRYIWNLFLAWKSHQDILIHPNLQWQRTWVHRDAVMAISRMPRTWLWLGESKSRHRGSKQNSWWENNEYVHRRAKGMNGNRRLPQWET